MLSFGMPALIEMEDLEATAALCRELRLSFIELNMNFPQYQMDRIDLARLRETARRYGIFYTLHLDDNMNVADFNPAVAQAYQNSVVEAVALARELDIPVINMHLSMGGVVTLPGRKVYLFEQYREEYMATMGAFRDRCHEAVGDSSVRICVENTAGYPAWQVEALDLLLESDAFGLTLDVGHDFCSGGGDLEIIRRRSSRLHHMHLHDAVKPKQDHLALGTGQLDLRDRLALAQQCGCTVVLETKTVAALRTSAAWLI
ncbi:MAG: sugar phosphate isomerase/epimerase [Oscillospiraceae bacterium]|nr:sugar phosphate isomerase/epimerase [Oscillospiraceae bacterium]